MPKISAYLFFPYLLVVSFFHFGFAQPKPNEQIRLNYLTTNDGLSQNKVDCILKDKKGFMWFGTWNGLCRFDGYNFKTFQKQQDEYLNGNMIQALCEDIDGNLWIGTENGLAFFNYDLFRFLPINELGKILQTSSINSIQSDDSGVLWVGTAENGLWEIKKDSNDKLFSNKRFSDLLPSENINHVYFSPQKELFVGTDQGLSVILPEIGKIASDFTSVSNTLKGTSIQSIFQDSEANIWIGTFDAGLYYYNTKTLNLNYFGASATNESDLDHLAVRDIIEDQNGNIIVGTLGGLNYFDSKSNTFSHLSDNQKLSSPFVNALYSDDLGNIWIGTEIGGVNYYNSYQKPFNGITHDPANLNSISYNTINSLLVEDGIIWIGTAGGGLNKVYKNKVTRYTFDPNDPQSINSDFISSLFLDNKQNLWVGTWGGGLNRLVSEREKHFDIWVNLPTDSTTICNSFISSIEPLDKDRFLIGTKGGLDIFNFSSNKFFHIHNKMNLPYPMEVGCLLTDTKDRIWVGTETGLYRFNKNELIDCESGSVSIAFKKFIHLANDDNSLASNYVISLFEASDGNIWLGTYGNGICKYVENEGQEKFKNYTVQDGLCNNVAYAIEEDSEGNLWISTDNGLSKFNPHDETFLNYYASDGLASNQFYWTASFNDSKGNLYFGGIGGVNYFSPSHIEPYPITSTPIFTEFSIFSDPVKIGEKYHSQVILSKPISETTQLNLSYKDAVFSIEFSAMDYFLPEKIRYAYQMEGVDKDWVEVPASRRFANYTNLSGGQYVFRVIAANSDGVWCKNPATLVINVKPPFWETALFQILALLVLVLLVMAYIRYRTRFLSEQKQKLETLVHERTHQIEKQNLELEKQNEKIARQRDEVIELNEKVNLINQLRLRFFTNISHEFRTPLTLIIDPLEQLLEKYKNDKNTSNTINIVNRNAQRLLHLINQLIYFRKIETGKLQLNVSRGNLCEFLNNIYSSFSDLAEKQGIDYEFINKNPIEETWFDVEKIENVFYNLLSNAFKFTPAAGSVKMKVEFINNSTEESIPNPYISVSVIDSGTGIDAKHLPHLFDRFYRAEQSKKDTDFTSSGIGLALTHEIVHALRGVIRVQSTPGEGSTFTVNIPYTKDRFQADEINENATPTHVNIEGRVKVLQDHIVARESGYKQEDEVLDDKSKSVVLIVEDNFDLRSFLVQTLRSDYRVLSAENGKIGLEMAKKYSPELIVSDVMMPVMDGLELCSHLKKNIQTSHIPVILLTAKNLVENWIEGLESGADDYIPKPFNLQILQAKMQNLIESRRKIKQLFSNPDDLSPDQVSGNKVDEEFISKVYAILEKNYAREEFSIDQLASDMFVSRSLLYKKIKALTDLNVTDFINSYKLKKAVALIRTTNKPISEVAFLVGFNDPKYFSRIFKKFYGSSPSDFTKPKTTN